MDLIIEGFLIAVIATVFSLCAKLSWDYYDIDELIEIVRPSYKKSFFSWKVFSLLTVVAIAVAEIVYWVFIK